MIVNSAVHNYPLNTGTTLPLSPRNPAGIPVTGIFFENSSVSSNINTQTWQALGSRAGREVVGDY